MAAPLSTIATSTSALVPAGSSIKEVADLAGKRVGIPQGGLEAALFRTANARPVSPSQSRTVPSSPADAKNFPFREKQTIATLWRWPVKSFAELIAYAKANPGKVNFGSAGAGSITHLAGELLKAEAKVDLVHVPYKGAAPAVTDLVGGQVQMGIFDVPVLLGHIRSGRLKALAITSPPGHDPIDVPSQPPSAPA